jgi:hypothetical protein
MSKDTRVVYMGTFEINKKLTDEKITNLRLDVLDRQQQLLQLRNDYENDTRYINKKLILIAVCTIINTVAILLQYIFS